MAHYTEVDAWEVLATLIYVTGRIYGPCLEEAHGRLQSWVLESEVHRTATRDWLRAARELLGSGQAADLDAHRRIAATELRLRRPIDDVLRRTDRRRGKGTIVGVLRSRPSGRLGTWFRRRESR
jgi:hypothetical protein